MLTRKSIGLWIVLLALLGGAGLVLGLTGGRLDDSGELREPYPPSPTRLRGSNVLPVTALTGSTGCGASGCHPDITQQWDSSAHHLSSFNNPFYTAAVDLLMAQEGGRTKARWCAGCHDPALLLSGNFDGEFDRTGALATEGIGCLICHAMEDDGDLRGNGAYTLLKGPSIPLSTAPGPLPRLGQAALKRRSGPHKRMLLRPLHRRAEMCLRCHKVSIPETINGYRWKRGQDEYGSWHQSGISGNSATTFHLGEESFTCIDCHMPELASEDEGNDEGLVASHRFAAANTALPFLRGDDEQLAAVEANLASGVLGIDIAALELGDHFVTPIEELEIRRLAMAFDQENGAPRLRFYVVVSNRAVGHAFPGGTIDSHEAWIRLTIRDADGRVLLGSGQLEPDGQVDAGARSYRARLLSAEGELLEKRNVHDWVATAYATTIGPGSADVARYRLELDASVALPLSIEAELLYRKFHPRFTRFVFEGETVPELPITVLARSRRVFPSDGSERLAAIGPDQRPIDPTEHTNDLGIALFLQGDHERANKAFLVVQRDWPERPDGPMNRARIAIAEGAIEAAKQALALAALRCEPGNPTLVYLWAVTLLEEGLHDDAITAFERARALKPQDLEVLTSLGRACYLAGRYESAVDAYERMLEIDPESLAAHNGMLSTLRAMGAPAEQIAERLQAVERYKADESEGAIAGRWLREHPLENRNAQPLWESAGKEEGR